MPRSHLMFDPTGSYGIPGNGIDLGRDFSTPTNLIAIQINARSKAKIQSKLKARIIKAKTRS